MILFPDCGAFGEIDAENLPDRLVREVLQSVKELPKRPRFCYNRRNGGCFHGRLEKRRTA